MNCCLYEKRPGTSGIRGQLYETKLISLILFRAKHNKSIEEFHIATNVDKIGDIDDICFRAKVKGLDKPLVVFIQAKHRENNTLITAGNKNDLIKYFDSYLKIRRAFNPSNDDILFKGNFNETECLFVMYTPARNPNNNNLIESSSAGNLNELIATGDNGSRLSYKDEDVEMLCKMALKEQITLLAVYMAQFVCKGADFKKLLANELMLRYHVILAQKVFDVSEVQPLGHRIASFREDFFDTNEEFLMLFKDALFTEILRKRKVDDKLVNAYLSSYYQQPPTVFGLSKLIGTIITYRNGKLEFIGSNRTSNNIITEESKQRLNKVHVTQMTADNAVELAAKEMLTSSKFRVPAAFGNKDLSIRGTDVKIENRLNYLMLKIFDLLNQSKPDDVVIIDESLENGFLQLNGGIASAVGNILVADKVTKLVKFTDNYEVLGHLATQLLKKLNNAIRDLHKYRFKIEVKNFPILSFDRCEHEENLVRDFLNKMLFYTNQADESGVERILKNEIRNRQRRPNNLNNFRLRADAIFLKYHDDIQQWWKSPVRSPYLTKTSEICENTIKHFVNDPLMSVINTVHINRMNINYKFKEDAVTFLKLLNHLSSTVVVTESSTLTVAKVIQYYKNEDYVLLDLEYIFNLHPYDFKALCAELAKASNDKILTFVCDNIRNMRSGRKSKLEIISRAVNGKNIIIITNRMSVDVIRKYFSRINIVSDRKNNLIDMSEEAQRNILQNASVIFQGAAVSLDLIVDDASIAFVEGDVLNQIINKKTIVVGKPVCDSNYDDIKHLYADRRVTRCWKPEPNRTSSKVIETFNDIDDDLVLITAIPGMGKSSLLTHLSLRTKQLDPKLWIVRINLLDYSREFCKLQQDKTVIDTLVTLNFICQVILREKHGKPNKVKIVLEELNDTVYLKHCTGDEFTVFELKMFLNFYNRGKLIFLFDGFDEICPHYTNVVLQFLKTVRNYRRKHKMWITSRSYNTIKNILQQEFGVSYEMDHFSYDEMEIYLEKFWKSNLILTELDSAQLQNVYEFIKFMSDSQEKLLNSQRHVIPTTKLQNLPLHEIYLSVMDYLKNTIKHSHVPLWTYNRQDSGNFNDFLARHLARFNGVSADVTDMYKFVGTPLHLYLIADYFQNEIKDVNKNTNKWNLDINSFTIYERFIETKLKKIRFQDKNKMDIYNPDIRMTYNKERANFIFKHKKLAAYAIFHRNNRMLFSRKELQEIKRMIKIIIRGGEKTGLIYSVANNIPTFVHMTFAEYFAVEYICDLLKREGSSENQKSILHFIFNVMFFQCPVNVLNIFDSKLKIDDALMSVLRKNNKIIFDILIEQGKGTGKVDIEEPIYDSSLKRAVSQNLPNFMSLFLSIFELHIDKDNFLTFLKILNEKRVFYSATMSNCDELICFAIDVVRKFDKSKISYLFGDLINVPNCDDFLTQSNEEILEIICVTVRSCLTTKLIYDEKERCLNTVVYLRNPALNKS